MLSLIEVKCPHCGARGQIMVPPAGAIIVGPCPECQGLVVVFCGQVLALKKDTMQNSSIKEQREHLMSVLTDFLRQRVTEIISEDSSIGKASAKQETEPVEGSAPIQHWRRPASKEAPISQDEVERFQQDELRLIDNSDYFKAIFG